MAPALVVMAAGIGSRYGGLKQIDPVGPCGEPIVAYSIYDALRAGFGKVVFVIKEEIAEAFREKIGRQVEKRVETEYVCQRLDDLPPGFAVPDGRRKPWGTAHAVYAARHAVNEPFAVINADDFYGWSSYRLLAAELGRMGDGPAGEYCLIGYMLAKTLTEHGRVARGICRVGGDGYLIEVREHTRIERRDGRIIGTADGETWEAAAFVDATGSAGPMGSCSRYGNGCAMCMFRCPSFGPRQGLSRLAGAREHAVIGQRPEPGVFSGSCDLVKSSLDSAIIGTLEQRGVVVVPLPEELVNRSKLATKACQQYALGPYAENLVILDNGYAKMMTPYMPLDDLRKIPGFERARYAEPLAGGRGNSIRYTSIAERDLSLRVAGVENLFCCGEKSGPYVGHTEAIATGALAGRNAAARAAGKSPLVLTRNTAVGDFIAMAVDDLSAAGGFPRTLTFAGAAFFERMKERGLYTTDRVEIAARVRSEGLEGVFERPVA